MAESRRKSPLSRDLARRFVTLGPDEKVEGEYLVAHTDLRRFTPVWVILLAGLALTGLAALIEGPIVRALEGLSLHGLVQLRMDALPPSVFGLGVSLLVLAVILVLWRALRRLEITTAHTVLTNERIVLYMRCDHPRENWHYLSEAAIDEVTGVWGLAGRGIIRKFVAIFVWTRRDVPIALAAYGFRGPLGGLLSATKSRDDKLIPGPDALTFVQEVSARVHELRAARRRTRRALESRGAPSALPGAPPAAPMISEAPAAAPAATPASEPAPTPTPEWDPPDEPDEPEPALEPSWRGDSVSTPEWQPDEDTEPGDGPAAPTATDLPQALGDVAHVACAACGLRITVKTGTSGLACPQCGETLPPA